MPAKDKTLAAFGRDVARCRAERGFSQHKVAEEADLDCTSVSGIERGVRDAAPAFIDLFCGCGGFTLGMERAGFRCLAAIDFNAEAVATLGGNASQFPSLTPERVFQEDLTRFGLEQLADRLAQLSTVSSQPAVDVIVGGPPCQGFSRARMRDGANHGSRRLVDDPRRSLYREFLRYVDFFQPRVFVMENVLGLRNAAGGEHFTAVQKEARELGRKQGRPGYRVHSQIEDAWELGVPQKRQRQLIIGVRNDLPGYFLPELRPAPRAEPRTWLWAAIGDLPILRAGGGEDERDYEFVRRVDHVERQGNLALKYLCRVQLLTRRHARSGWPVALALIGNSSLN